MFQLELDFKCNKYQRMEKKKLLAKSYMVNISLFKQHIVNH